MLCESPTSDLILPGPRGLLPPGLQFYHGRYSSLELDLLKPLKFRSGINAFNRLGYDFFLLFIFSVRVQLLTSVLQRLSASPKDRHRFP